MAKTAHRASEVGNLKSLTESKVDAFAEDIGRLLGKAQAKAEGWLDQRKEIVTQLSDIRDTVTRLLADLGHQAQQAVRRGRPARASGATKVALEPPRKRTRRKMSAKARKAISDAQKARWALVRAQAKKR